MELELSTTTASGGFNISILFVVSIGFTNNNNIPKMLRKRKKAKSKLIFDLLLAL